MDLYYIHYSWQGGSFGNHGAFNCELPPLPTLLKLKIQ